VASALERNLPVFPVLVDGAAMPDPKDLPDDLKSIAFRQAFSVRHDSFPRDMGGLEQELRRVLSKRRTWTLVTVISGLFILSLGAISHYFWTLRLPSARTYTNARNFACFDDTDYPKSWRGEASLCVAFGCNFGKMTEDACLALGAKKQSKTVIHGNPGTSRANECWLQDSCGDLRPYNEFTLFKM
jgi:hypothetical protein